MLLFRQGPYLLHTVWQAATFIPFFGLDFQEFDPITVLNINCMYIITVNVTTECNKSQLLH